MPRHFLWERILLAVTIAVVAHANGQALIRTFAGGGSPYFYPNMAALGAPLGAVSGVAADGAGNLYIADPTLHVVSKVSLNGTLTLIAGNGTKGFSGDQALASNAVLNSPQGVAVDQTGNVYIADTGNNRIRKVSATSGLITTIAGGVDSGSSGNGGPAVNALLNAPAGVAVDTSGNVYIADTGNNQVRMINSSGTISAIYKGGSGPRGVAVDFYGNVYIADTGHHRVIEIQAPVGAIVSVAGTGLPGFGGDDSPGATSVLNTPIGVAVDQLGTLYIADSQNQRIRKVARPSTQYVTTTIAGNGFAGFSGDGGPSTIASLNVPLGVAVDPSGNVYIADSLNDRVRKADSAGTISSVAGGIGPSFSGDGVTPFSVRLSNPSGMSIVSEQTEFGPFTTVYIADTDNNRIRQADGSGTIVTIAGTGIASYSGDGEPGVAASLNGPKGVFADSSGNVFVADTGNHRIRKINSADFITTVAGNGTATYAGDGSSADASSLSKPSAVIGDSAGNLFIADTGNHVIRKVNPAGIISTIAGTGKSGFAGDSALATNALLNSPSGLALDAAGNLYIADTQNNRVRKVDRNGIISTVVASLTPTGLAFDTTGNLYIVENGGNRVRMMNSSGAVSTVAGNGGPGYSGDGALAVNAQLNGPFSIAFDIVGNLYIADAANNAVREVFLPVPSMVATPAFDVFGATVGTKSAAQTTTLYNEGEVVVTISSIATTSGRDFQQTNTCGTSIAVGASCTISVVFAPQTAGAQAAVLTITGNAGSQSYLLNGVGIAPIAPAISSSGVTSAASFQPGLIPGGLVSVFGQNFAAAAAGASTSPFPTTLGGVQVTINGIATPIFYVSPTQINIQAPSDLKPGIPASVVVTVNGVSGTATSVGVNAVQPAIFTLGGTFGNQGAILLANTNTFAMPVTPGIASAPVHVGDFVSIFCTGLGATTPGVSTNSPGPSSPPALAATAVTASIGGLPATVSFAGLAPGFIGLYQANAQVPTGVAASSAVPVILTQSGVPSNTATISVQ